jgi:NitT/TauT family transport system ATP-binding protein
VTALDGITFDIGRNEFLAVLGPSGCGKSTLLRLIAGLIFPTRGTVSIYDLAVTEPRDEIGIVFQSPTLLPWFDLARQCDLSAPPQIWARQRGR